MSYKAHAHSLMWWSAVLPLLLILLSLCAAPAGAQSGVLAWGANGSGQLGDGTTTERHLVAPVSSLSSVVSIVCGYYYNLALRSDGTVWAWGSNVSGQLGDGTTTSRQAPVKVSGLTGIIA
jgi:alpha-tubulin suppressor-like RCC1 family protein